MPQRPLLPTGADEPWGRHLGEVDCSTQCHLFCWCNELSAQWIHHNSQNIKLIFTRVFSENFIHVAMIQLLVKSNPPGPACDCPPVWAGIGTVLWHLVCYAGTQQEFDRSTMAAAFPALSKPMRRLLFIMSMLKTIDILYIDRCCLLALTRRRAAILE